MQRQEPIFSTERAEAACVLDDLAHGNSSYAWVADQHSVYYSTALHCTSAGQQSHLGYDDSEGYWLSAGSLFPLH